MLRAEGSQLAVLRAVRSDSLSIHAHQKGRVKTVPMLSVYLSYYLLAFLF